MITKTYKFKTSTIAHCYTPDLKGAIKHYEITHPGYYIGGAWVANQLDLLTAYIKLEQSLKTKFNG